MALGVSPRQLQRLFATHLGTSFKRFDRGLRLERAKELLEQTAMTVMPWLSPPASAQRSILADAIAQCSGPVQAEAGSKAHPDADYTLSLPDHTTRRLPDSTLEK